MTENQGTLVIAPIRPYDDADTYASALSTEIKGGLHEVADTTARDAITTERRFEGMMCYCIADTKTYQLVGGITNDKWIELSSGGVPVETDPLSLHLDQTTPQNIINGAPTFNSGLKILEGGASPTKHTLFQGGDQTASITYTLPTAQAIGIGNEFLKNNGSGNLSWTNAVVTETDPLSLHLDQTTPQQVINGAPKFNAGIKILETGATPSKYTSLTGGDQTIDLDYILPREYPQAVNVTQFLTATDTSNLIPGRMSWEPVYQVPPGTILMYGNPTTLPTGYLACDGTSYPTASYPNLFTIIGYSFGGIGANFNVPDMRIRFPKGFSNGVNAIGNTGGQASVTPTFTGNALATHNHTFTGDALGNHTHTPGEDAISAGTPSGSIDSHATTTITALAGTKVVLNNPGTHTFSGNVLPTHQHNPTNTSNSAGTPAGTNSATSGGTPSGSISAVSTEPAYLILNYIIKT
jgi:microcystin-dependent protein